MDDFLLRAFAAGVGVAMVAGVLGCFVVWRRMAYFGDTLAHAALLGVALGFLFGVDPGLGIVGVCLAVALLLVGLRRQRRLATDTVLGMLAHTTLAAGLVVLAVLRGARVDLFGYLFGDVLAVTARDLYWIYGGGTLVLAALVPLWRTLLLATLHEDLARAEGAPVRLAEVGLMLLMALVIAVALKIVGILLITSLMILPAATARRFARTPEQMAVLAAIVGAVAVAGGLAASFRWDTPSGPSIVLAAGALFLLAGVGAAVRRAAAEGDGN